MVYIIRTAVPWSYDERSYDFEDVSAAEKYLNANANLH
jgi:hypothetical protein